MNKLEMYKRLSNEDKSNLTAYCIYDSIYINARNSDKEISDEDVERIYELSHYLYLKDEYYDFSSSKIADYITIGYLDNNISLDKLEEVDRTDMYMGIDNDDYDWLLENEMER